MYDREGKTNLSSEIVKTLNSMLIDGSITAVFFTEFSVK